MATSSNQSHNDKCVVLAELDIGQMTFQNV